MLALTSESAKLIQAKRRYKGPRNPKSELREMQQLLLVDIRNPKTPPHIRAQCVRAYDICEERLRILHGRPLPGQYRPDGNALPFLERRKRKAPVAPLETLPDVAPKEPTIGS